MKQFFLIILCFFVTITKSKTSAQSTNGSITVGGSISNFYPVTFTDPGYDENIATVLELGRSNTHTNDNWRGSMIASFKYHTHNWGNGSSFINAEIYQNKHFLPDNDANSFVAGWADATGANGDKKIIIWLRGGTTTYYFKSNLPIGISVYDGVVNPAVYNQTNGPSHSAKTSVDDYVNLIGQSFAGDLVLGGNSFFKGSIGIGTNKKFTTYKLAVDGIIGTRKIKVTQETWADHVFKPDYQLRPLGKLEAYIKKYKHLPDVPSEQEVLGKDVDISETQVLLLKKIEELTLYVIALKKENELQQKEINTLKRKK